MLKSKINNYEIYRYSTCGRFANSAIDAVFLLIRNHHAFELVCVYLIVSELVGLIAHSPGIRSTNAASLFHGLGRGPLPTSDSSFHSQGVPQALALTFRMSMGNV